MNISKGDILELRRRMTKKGCTIDRFCGCYVAADKRRIMDFNEDFSELDEDRFFKYLEIVKKVMSSSLGSNILELQFQRNETGNEHQRFLYALKASKLDNPDMIERMYEKIIENYAYMGNYLILLFHDVYDVPVRTKDRMKTGESEETFEYMLCAICPVEYSKANLRYFENENSISLTDRDWVVGQPDLGFMYPAFSNHGADASALMYFVKTGRDSHAELIEDGLGCISQRTAGEEKTTFRAIIEDTFEDPQQGESVFLKIQKQVNDLTLPDPDAPEEGDETPPVSLTEKTFVEVLERVDMPEEAKEIIISSFEKEFGEQPPIAQNVVDKKLVEESVQRLRTAELETVVVDLKEQLNDKEQELAAAKSTASMVQTSAIESEDTPDAHLISLHLSVEKAKQIYGKTIDGKKCIIIPVEHDDSTTINGIPTEL